jgi:RNA recognition motif-containing protein
VLVPAENIEQLVEAIEQANASKSNTGTVKEKKTRTRTRTRKPRSTGERVTTERTAKPRKFTEDAELASRSVFITGLAWLTTESEIFEHCRVTAGPKHIQLGKRRDGRSLGFAVVEFDTRDEAVRVMEELNETSLGDRIIKVRQDRTPADVPEADRVRAPRAPKPKAESEPREPRAPREPKPKKERRPVSENRVINPLKIMVKNLSYESSNDDIQNHFESHGSIHVETLTRQRTGRSLGLAIVTFDKISSAVEALERLNGTKLDDRELQLLPYYEDIAV